MPKAYSGEMRERVIAEVESGASRREAASAAIRNWRTMDAFAPKDS